MEPPPSDEEVKPKKLEEVKAGPSFHCNLFDAEIVYKIAEALLPGLASACVDNTIGGLFKSPASVAVDIRREMVDYLFQRSENFVAESVVLEGGPPDQEVSDHPYDIISDFIDDFASSKRNIFSRVSGWLLSDRREDRIDDFVQEMEINGFWLLGRREAVAQTLLKNIDFKNTYHCDQKFLSTEELTDHISACSFRIMDCMNEGCNSRFTAGQMNYHDSTCPFKVIPCDQKCPETIMRRDMDRHCITVCPMKLVNCPFYAVGCRCTIPRSTIDQHHSEYLPSHLLNVLKSLHKDASLYYLKKRVEQMEKSSLPGRLLAATDARSLIYVVKNLEANLGPLEVGKAGEQGAEVNDGEEEKTELSPKIAEPTKDHVESPTNDIKNKCSVSSSKHEKNRDSLDEKEESPTKHIGSSDSSPSKLSMLPSKLEDSTNMLDEKEELPIKYFETTDSSTRKHSTSPSKQEESRNSPIKNIESTDSSPGKHSVSSSQWEHSRKSLDEKESTTKPIESTDSSPEKLSVSFRQEENRKSLDEKEESPTEHSESTDSSPGKFPLSPSKHEENRKSLDEKVNYSSLTEDKYPESLTERDLFVELPTKKYTESTTEKEEHAKLPLKGDEST